MTSSASMIRNPRTLPSNKASFVRCCPSASRIVRVNLKPSRSRSKLPGHLHVPAALDLPGLQAPVDVFKFHVVILQEILPNHAEGEAFPHLPRQHGVQPRVRRNLYVTARPLVR